MPRYKRIVLKLSGEAIEGKNGVFNIHMVERIADEIKSVHKLEIEIGVVIGGGNIIRGRELVGHGLDRIPSDSMGMLATVINSILLEDILIAKGVPAVLQSALAIDTVAEAIDLKRTKRYLQNGNVILFAGGTGSPYFTTDTAAALRACEIGADVLMKATKVNGIFDRDPEKYKDSTFFKTLSYSDVLNKRFMVMDMAAVSMCRDRNIPIVIFNILKEGTLVKIAEGDDLGTTIKEE